MINDFPPVRIARIDVHILRHPIAKPVQTSFGLMHERPALFVRVEDADGAYGWGEIWCNYPACGAEHRANLTQTVLWPLLAGREFASPQALYRALTAATAVLAIQSGEPGPIAQAIAGVDLAVWDLCARRAGEPLWRVLGGASGTIGVYASGLNPDMPEEVVARRSEEGYRAFKLKVGFEPGRDLENLRKIVDIAGSGASIMVDANQAWDLETAQKRVRELAEFELEWIEEPLRADRPWKEWRELAVAAPAPLAAGENVAGELAFRALFESAAVKVVQPDVAKWGGISGVLPVIQEIKAHGLRYCPHYLGGGIGLLHSAHLLAAVGGEGWLEIDANENPLRTQFCGPLDKIMEGRAQLADSAGIGVDPDL
ncbi:L-rhamnonate dehydratase [Pigmentiphaga humi]|uniref:L-rhamnonate dehydratase n=1 Tax=Pigmentiphaga humi TaxID=2478468 RepID=A0A3P4B771_9BURK|nr:mandelate racemase/muconate lactonizing enzyme family protein [Pigmentiphaga humi]VCU71460.1 L-rhamnonate dehydratase [Pigmentiphaga humi]